MSKRIVTTVCLLTVWAILASCAAQKPDAGAPTAISTPQATDTRGTPGIPDAVTLEPDVFDETPAPSAESKTPAASPRATEIPTATAEQGGTDAPIDVPIDETPTDAPTTAPTPTPTPGTVTLPMDVFH